MANVFQSYSVANMVVVFRCFLKFFFFFFFLAAKRGKRKL